MIIEWRDDGKYVCLLEKRKCHSLSVHLKKRRREEENIKERIRQEEDGGGKRKQK